MTVLPNNTYDQENNILSIVVLTQNKRCKIIPATKNASNVNRYGVFNILDRRYAPIIVNVTSATAKPLNR